MGISYCSFSELKHLGAVSGVTKKCNTYILKRILPFFPGEVEDAQIFDEQGALTSILNFTAAGRYNISVLHLGSSQADIARQTQLSYDLTVQAGLPDPAASSVDGPGLYNAIAGQTAVFWVCVIKPDKSCKHHISVFPQKRVGFMAECHVMLFFRSQASAQ